MHMRLVGFTLSSLFLFACGDAASSGRDATPETDAADTAVEDTAVDDLADTVEGDSSEGDSDTADAADTASDTREPNASFTVIDLPSPVDLTPDGDLVVLWDWLSERGATWVYEVASKTLTLEVEVGSPQRNFPTAVSSNLVITALHGEPVQAGRWDGASWRDLGSLFDEGCGLDPEQPTMGEVGGAWDISADGAIIVGSLWDGCTTAAFRWSDDNTRDFRILEVLGEVAEGATMAPINRATVVSDDGRIAAGFAQTALVDRWPAIWDTASATGYLLTTELFPSDAPGEVLAISADGGAVSGIWNNQAFVAKLGTSITVTALDPLPDVMPSEASRANVVSAGGDLAFGQSGGPFFSIGQAFVWTREGGTRNLKEVAIALGATIAEDVILTNVLAGTGDGSILVGTFTDNSFVERTFILTVKPSSWRQGTHRN